MNGFCRARASAEGLRVPAYNRFTPLVGSASNKKSPTSASALPVGLYPAERGVVGDLFSPVARRLQA